MCFLLPVDAKIESSGMCISFRIPIKVRITKGMWGETEERGGRIFWYSEYKRNNGTGGV